MLKPITFTEAKALINAKLVFAYATIFDGGIEFEIMNEPDYDGGVVNYSYRSGDIYDELMKENFFDIFYHEYFQNDGGLEYYENYPSVVDLLNNSLYTPLMENGNYYLTDGNTKEILSLSDNTRAWFIKKDSEVINDD